MKVCPRCGDEFEDAVVRCPDHDVLLVPPGTPPPPPDADALLGTFHPAVAELLVGTLEHRLIPHDRFVLDDEVELLVPAEHRADLRSELVVNWPELLDRIPEEQREEVRALGGQLPGWHDAPEGAWVDRQGRLQVSEAPDHEGLDDARRTLGPMLVVAGTTALLLGWYLGGQAATPLILAGGAAVGVGLFLPR
ncbi:MAG TPA: hypothetical protein VGA69_12775 [Nitriliruptorales bacterium]